MSNIAEIRDLTFGYGERKILDGLNMTFPKGKVVAVMGISGSGKTTILRLLGGLITPQKGEVLLDGERLQAENTEVLYQQRKKMGMLFQHGALFTDLSVFDNVAFPLREQTNLPEEIIHDLVLMKLDAVGLRNAAWLMPSEISGGMARRVALARTIALDPQLILYDEPFTGLDPISMGITANLMHRLNEALQSTTVLVSHDVPETFAIADYVYFLAEGMILAQGTPDELEKSTDPFVYQFVHAQMDGPVAFHYPGRSIAEDLDLEKAS